MGGKHATFNMAIWDRDFAADASPRRSRMLSLRRSTSVKASTFWHSISNLCTWQDLPNPMALLPHQTSANDCPAMTMVPGAPETTRISHSMRQRLKTKERKLKALPGYRYQLAVSDADIKRLLDCFFRIKPLRMAEQKLPNVFAEPGVEDFIRDAGMTPRLDGGRVIEIHALENDDEVIALFAGVADGYRFSMMFNTYTMSAISRYSPGLILMRHIIDHYAEHGYRTLDLGIGSDELQKAVLQGGRTDLRLLRSAQSAWLAAAAAMSAANRAKRLVKHNPALLRLAQKLRRAFG